MAKGTKKTGKTGKTDYRALAVFARTLGTLQQSGVPILESMEMTAKSTENRALAAAIMEARGSMREGLGIGVPLRATGGFPKEFIMMVSAGEEAGKLDEMLLKIGDYYLEVAEGRGADEITLFACQLAAMLKAGSPLGKCIAILAENAEGKTKKVLEAVAHDMTGGAHFFAALAKHPETFDTVFVSMVKAGEIGGSLDAILQRIGEIREFTARAKRGKRG